jgi:hypothetical protein
MCTSMQTMRLQLETEINTSEGGFTKVYLCTHVSAYVFISELNQSLTIKCKYCGDVTWSNKDDEESSSDSSDNQ